MAEGIILSPQPPKVPQGTAPQCWAAAFTSWLAVNKNRKQLNKRQLLDRYGDAKKGGSIEFSSDSWQELTEDFNLTPSKIARIQKFDDLTPNERIKHLKKQEKEMASALLFLLHKFGYQLFVYNHTRSRLSGVISHMVLIFGFRFKDGRILIKIMDPARNGTIREMPMQELLGFPTVFIHTREAINKERKPRPIVTGVPEERTTDKK